MGQGLIGFASRLIRGYRLIWSAELIPRDSKRQELAERIPRSVNGQQTSQIAVGLR
jgi:hypothetical protein